MPSGKAHKYGDNVNTDVIYPGKYTYQQLTPEEMAKHAMEDIDAEFFARVESGDVIVAGKNFGCGSSREQAASCLKYAGISAIIAESFSRLFYRNAINFGLLAIAQPDAAQFIQPDDEVEIDSDGGTICARGKEFQFSPPPPMVKGILDAGGLVPYLNKTLGSM